MERKRREGVSDEETEGTAKKKRDRRIDTSGGLESGTVKEVEGGDGTTRGGETPEI